MSLGDYYPSLTKRMLAEMKTSRSIGHPGEQGRNNEKILMGVLGRHLPIRYSFATGKVVASDGSESRQTDIIIRDRLTSPALITAEEWDLVPIESTVGVVSVKTTLDKGELEDAAKQIASVRCLSAKPITYVGGRKQQVPAGHFLRPRALVFAYESKWVNPASLETAFKDVLRDIDDNLRPNGVCVVNQALITIDL